MNDIIYPSKQTDSQKGSRMKLEEAIAHMETMIDDFLEAEENAYMEYIDDPGDDWAEDAMRQYRKDIEAMRVILKALKQ